MPPGVLNPSHGGPPIHQAQSQSRACMIHSPSPAQRAVKLGAEYESQSSQNKPPFPHHRSGAAQAGPACGPPLPSHLGACLKPEIANRRQASVSRPDQTRPEPDLNGGPPAHMCTARSPPPAHPSQPHAETETQTVCLFLFTGKEAGGLVSTEPITLARAHSRSLHCLPPNQHHTHRSTPVQCHPSQPNLHSQGQG